MSTKFSPDFKLFLEVKNAHQLARVLAVSYPFLTRTLYGDNLKYHTFSIAKKNGGTRQIKAPSLWLKIIQRRLSLTLLDGFSPKPTVHGFVKERGIKTNALVHLRKRYVINIDLQDFFPTIHFGRVRGLFMNHPFSFDEKMASLLSNLVCHEEKLPQGAPTSPIISNYICRSLDLDLLTLAIRNKCHYTRYADDITFSTNLKKVPEEIGVIADNSFEVSTLLQTIINLQGFQINPLKVRYADRRNRQDVTGLTINERVNIRRSYVRHVRVLLRAWEKFGLDLAASHYYTKFSSKRIANNAGAAYIAELTGKIGFIGYIKGKDDPVYVHLASRFRTLHPPAAVKIVLRDTAKSNLPLVFGEGKTDWKHLKAAFKTLKHKYGPSLDIEIYDYANRTEVNNSSLLALCEAASKMPLFKTIVFCVFDADRKEFVSKASEANQNFKYWGNNVYSIVLPKPNHRSNTDISIEHYYTDDEIKTYDADGRRLYLSEEFDKSTGKHLTQELMYGNPNALKKPTSFIIDHNVINDNGSNVALSKTNFANNIFYEKPGFRHFSFNAFQLVFDLIAKLINEHPHQY